MNAVSNNIIDYLKSIDVSGNNKHEEYETNDYLLSVVMITLKNKISENICTKYSVCLVCADKDKNIIFDDLKSKDFYDINSANNYYNELKNSMKTIDIKSLINS